VLNLIWLNWYKKTAKIFVGGFFVFKFLVAADAVGVGNGFHGT